MSFIYRPLEPGSGHVRYVSLAPGNHGGPISLILIHAPSKVAASSSTASNNDIWIDESEPSRSGPCFMIRERYDQASSSTHTSIPQHTASIPGAHCETDTSQHLTRFTGRYSALSYCWGNRSTKYDILLRYLDRSGPGAIFTISENLHSFLRCYSQRSGQEDEPVWLWIDQLCIDQSNNAEKHGQISLMGDIYSQATLVIVWLGPAFEQSDQLIKALHMGLRWSFSRVLTVFASRHHNDSLYKLAIRELKRSALAVLGPYMDTLESMLGLAYWSRVWICQEFLLAENGIIYLGNSSLSIKDFCRQLQYLKNIRALDALSAKKVMQCQKLVAARFYDMKTTWEALLRLMENRKCERYEDRIYGIIGLLRRSTEFYISISMPVFSGSRKQFFRNVVRQLMAECLDDASPDSEEYLLYCAGYNALTVCRLLQLESEFGRFAVLKVVLCVFSELMGRRMVSTAKIPHWAALAGSLGANFLVTSMERRTGESVRIATKHCRGLALSMSGTLEPYVS